MNETSIAMQTFSTLLMIEVELWSIEGNVYKPMYITFDTGASITTISSEILYLLGYSVMWVHKKASAQRLSKYL